MPIPKMVFFIVDSRIYIDTQIINAILCKLIEIIQNFECAIWRRDISIKQHGLVEHLSEYFIQLKLSDTRYPYGNKYFFAYPCSHKFQTLLNIFTKLKNYFSPTIFPRRTPLLRQRY